MSKATILFLLLFLNLGVFCFAQTDTLNQFDANGKKQGKWLIYWDNIWKEVADSSKAVYCRYSYYDHGKNLFPMGPCGRKKWKMETESKEVKRIGKLILLDGKYKWKDEKGLTNSIQVFNNGEYVEAQELYSTEKIEQHFQYSKKYKGQNLSWAFTSFDKNGKVKYEGYFRKGPKGWTIYPVAWDNIE